jgi:hypothetical protein
MLTLAALAIVSVVAAQSQNDYRSKNRKLNKNYHQDIRENGKQMETAVSDSQQPFDYLDRNHKLNNQQEDDSYLVLMPVLNNSSDNWMARNRKFHKTKAVEKSIEFKKKELNDETVSTK